LLGFPKAALKDADDAINYARESDHAPTLMNALLLGSWLHVWCGQYLVANAGADELANLADKKGALLRKAGAMGLRGWLLALTGKASDAIQTINLTHSEYRSTGSTVMMPLSLSHLARAYAEVGQFGAAWCCIEEAMTAIETTGESWYEAEVHRFAGEIVLRSPEPDAARAEAYFERALAVAREQQAKSWELRAATGLARVWRDQDKRQQAHDLLAPIYSRFTEGFDTLDLKEAKALLEQLKA
jgi:predicted ATPase